MADREIVNLTEAESLNTDDLFLVRQNGEARKVTVQQLKEEFGGGGGGAAGAYQFKVDTETGDLICVYEGSTPPAYEINDDGDLILTVGDGQEINVGHVQGRNGKAGTTPTIGSDGYWYIGATSTGVKAQAQDGIDGTQIAGITATVDESVGTPSCTVTQGGTNDSRTYTLAFSGLKGKDGEVSFSALTNEEKASLKGDPGTDGTTIESVTVTVDDTTGTPSCEVAEGGTDTARTYTLAFSGLKGSNGKDGTDGIDGKDNLPTVETVPDAIVSLTLSHNVEYRCTGTVTSLTISGFTAATDGKASMWALQFTAGDGIAVTVPESVTWAVAAPIWTAGVTYWFSFVPLITGKILGVWVSDE